MNSEKAQGDQVLRKEEDGLVQAEQNQQGAKLHRSREQVVGVQAEREAGRICRKWRTRQNCIYEFQWRVGGLAIGPGGMESHWCRSRGCNPWRNTSLVRVAKIKL